MAAATAIIATTLAAGSVISAVDQKKAAKRAQRKQESANAIERARASVQAGINRKRSVAQARMAAAQNIASNSASGVGEGSSQLQGSLGSLWSNVGTGIASARGSFVSSQSAFDQRQSAANTLGGSKANAGLAQAGMALFQTGAGVYSGGSGGPQGTQGPVGQQVFGLNNQAGRSGTGAQSTFGL